MATPGTGLGGPTGTFLYKWIPDWALGISCDNTTPDKVVTGSACDLYFKKMAQLYPLPPMPVAPGVPVNLPANPASREQAEDIVQAVVDARANAQREQTQNFFNEVAWGLEEYENRTTAAANTNTLLFWGLGIVAAIWLVKR